MPVFTPPLLNLDTLHASDAADVLDVRSEAAFKLLHIEGATSLPVAELIAQKGVLASKSRLLVLSDSTEAMAEAARLLSALGFEDKVWVFPFGITALHKHPQAQVLPWQEAPLASLQAAGASVQHWYGTLSKQEKGLTLGGGAVLVFTLLRSLNPIGLGITLSLLAFGTRKHWQPLLKETDLKQAGKLVLKQWLLKKFF